MIRTKVTLPPCVKKIRFKSKNTIPTTLQLVGEITEESATELIESIVKCYEAMQSIIPIVINSEGGCVYSAISICNTLKSAPQGCKVVTIVSGACMSASVLIFSCGQQRIIHHDGIVMIHDVLISGLEGSLTNIKTEAIEMERINRLMYKQLALNVGQEDENYFLNLKRNNTDHYLSPEACVASKLATDIVNNMPVLSVDLSITMDMILEKSENKHTSSSGREKKRQKTI